MGGIAVAISKQRQNAAETVLTMLREIAHRGRDGFGVASHSTVEIAESYDKIKLTNFVSNIILGHAFTKILAEDEPQPVLGSKSALILEGDVFSTVGNKCSDSSSILKMVEANPKSGVADVIRKFNGAYVIAVAEKNKLIVGRDPLGVCPLYYSENSEVWAAASERKALWKIGLKNVESFPTGNIATITAQSAVYKPVRVLRRMREKALELEAAAFTLQKILRDAVDRRVSSLGEVAVAFSGGIDSSIIAFLAEQCGVKAHLFTVGLEGQVELAYAEKVAALLRLPIHIETYTVDDVESLLPTVLWLIEKPNALDAGVAVPIYWAAENASKMGFNIMLSGQGSDELFGGYMKYLKILENSGKEKLQERLFHDVSKSYETNYQRDNNVASFHGVELRLPFADWELTNFALSIPIDLKVQPKSNIRKLVLRQAARRLGLPALVAGKPKKAMQYTTGADKALRKLAKREKLSLQNYLIRRFRNCFPVLSPDMEKA